MTRFTLPALGMIAAIAVLVAGAFGDLPSWRSEVPVIVAQTSRRRGTTWRNARRKI
jgi:hypothetical protein